MSTPTDGDPWMQAWRTLKAFIESGASEQEPLSTPGSWVGIYPTPATRWPTHNKPKRWSKSYGKS